MITTTRLALDVPQGTDSVSAYPAAASQALGILDNAAIYLQGTLVDRPTAGSVAAGTIYYATDTSQVYFRSGSAWVPYAPQDQTTEITSNYTAVAAEIVIATGSGPWTVTLPSPTANSTVTVIAFGSVSGANQVTVTTPSGSIYGLGQSSGSSIVLGASGSAARLWADGTDWLIVSGQQDSGWVSVTSTLGEPSYRRVKGDTSIGVQYSALGATTVAHGLSGTPTIVLATGNIANIEVSISGITSTDIVLNADATGSIVFEYFNVAWQAFL